MNVRLPKHKAEVHSATMFGSFWTQNLHHYTILKVEQYVSVILSINKYGIGNNVLVVYHHKEKADKTYLG